MSMELEIALRKIANQQERNKYHATVHVDQVIAALLVCARSYKMFDLFAASTVLAEIMEISKEDAIELLIKAIK